MGPENLSVEVERRPRLVKHNTGLWRREKKVSKQVKYGVMIHECGQPVSQSHMPCALFAVLWKSGIASLLVFKRNTVAGRSVEVHRSSRSRAPKAFITPTRSATFGHQVPFLNLSPLLSGEVPTSAPFLGLPFNLALKEGLRFQECAGNSVTLARERYRRRQAPLRLLDKFDSTFPLQ